MLKSPCLKADSTHNSFNLSQYNQQEITTSLSFSTEDIHLIFHQLFNNSFQNIYFRYLDVFFTATNLMDMRISRDTKLFPVAFQDFIATIGIKYQNKIQDWPPPVNGFKNGGDSEVALNILDAVLKSSLDRLKLMRENMPDTNIKKRGYREHINTIRNLSLGGRLGAALWLHNKMILNNFNSDLITHNHLVNGFCKVGDFEKAEWVITQMSHRGPPPNCATYNTLMKGYCAFNDIEKALDLLKTMSDDNDNVKPNIVTFNILVHALCEKGLLDEARVLFSKLTDENREKNVIGSTILMDSYFKDGNSARGFAIWREISEKSNELDVVAYNVLVNGCYSSSDPGLIRVFKYVNEMLKIGLNPDIFTYNTLINVFCKTKRINDACYLFYDVIPKMGCLRDIVSYNTLIRGLCDIGNVVEGHELLNHMLKNSMIPKPRIWNIVINGYARNGDKLNAFSVKDQMITHGVTPNVFTFNALIHMFIKDGELLEARLLMKEMLTVGPGPDIVTYNLLVGAECEFGHLYAGEQVYDEMLKRGYCPDLVTYTKLIKGYCLRGKVNEAERLFISLCEGNLVIDHVPFQILIKQYFKMMDFDRAYGVYQKWVRME